MGETSQEELTSPMRETRIPLSASPERIRVSQLLVRVGVEGWSTMAVLHPGPHVSTCKSSTLSSCTDSRIHGDLPWYNVSQ